MNLYFLRKIIYIFLVQAVLSLVGCASSSPDYNPSMDFNPAWRDQDPDKVTSFDQLPRHKNRMEYGYE